MKPTINQVLENPELLNHDECYSFYDWFCKDAALKSRAEAFLPKLKFLVEQGVLSGEHRVWFKNNCPMNGTLYDDMRISDKEDNFLGGFCPKSGHYNMEQPCSVWTLDNPDVENGLLQFEFDTWNDLKKAVKNDAQFAKVLHKKFG